MLSAYLCEIGSATMPMAMRAVLVPLLTFMNFSENENPKAEITQDFCRAEATYCDSAAIRAERWAARTTHQVCEVSLSKNKQILALR